MTCLEHITGSIKCMQLVFRFLNNLVPGMSTNPILLHLLLTSAYCVHSNVYGLINTCCFRYHTVIDPIHSTSPMVQVLYFPSCGSVDIQLVTSTRNSSSIGEEPVSIDLPPIIRMTATSSQSCRARHRHLHQCPPGSRDCCSGMLYHWVRTWYQLHLRY